MPSTCVDVGLRIRVTHTASRAQKSAQKAIALCQGVGCQLVFEGGWSSENSAHLDEVGLRSAHARVLRRAHRLAGARGQTRVTRADRPLLVVVLLAAPAEEDRHLDRGTADLHGWRVGVRDEL